MARVVSPRFEISPTASGMLESKVTGIFQNTTKKYSRTLGESETVADALALIGEHAQALPKLEILIYPS
jgi:hypothetical protein